MRISKILQNWYERNKRDLPWRNTQSPYKIWLSEIILQQTRVDQGLPYYEKFIDKYPDVYFLSKAEDDDIFKLWQGLGYYNRARNMLHTARFIVKECNGRFPGNYDEILKLKGVGKYTAAAIASFAYNLPYAVVDGNVSRVISRMYCIEEPMNSTKGIHQIGELAEEILDVESPGIHNQAIMEFGSQLCTPVNPNCDICPLKSSCIAFNKNKVNTLPIKERKTKIKNRYLNYFAVEYNNSFYLNKRQGNDIWRNLYEFVLIETSKKNSLEEIINGDEWQKLFENVNPIIDGDVVTFKHQLSHRLVHASFYYIKIKKPLVNTNFNLVAANEISKFPVSRLTEKYMLQKLFKT